MALPFGGVGTLGGVLLGLLIVVAALGVLTLFGRRRQAQRRGATRRLAAVETLVLRITTGSSGVPVPPLEGSPSRPIRSTTAMPLDTRPSVAYSGARSGAWPVTTKNWLPAVPDGSDAVLAMATMPRW